MQLRRLMPTIACLALITAACGSDDTANEPESVDNTTVDAENDDTESNDTATDDTASESGSQAPSSDAPDSDSDAETGAEPTGSLAVAFHIAPITLNPHVSQPGPQYGHLEAVYDTLVRVDQDGELVAGLATEWEYVDDDNLQLQMTLRTGVTFHDGEDFDAEVAKANLDASRSAAGARTALLDPIDSIEVVDDETILITLSRPEPILVQTFAQMLGMIVSPNLLGTDAIESDAIGTGPYVYDADASVPGERYEFTAFDDYWDDEAAGRPADITLMAMTDAEARLNALRSGQLDGAYVLGDQVDTAEDDGFEIISRPDKFWGIVIFDRNGERVPELGMVEVRQAMNFAIDRQAILDTLFFGRGIATEQFWNPDDSAYSQEAADIYPYDPDRARELLADVGVDGFSFTAPFLPFMSNFGQAVQGYLAEVGIDMQIEIVEPGTLGAEALSGDWAATGMVSGGVETAPSDTKLWIAPEARYNVLGTTSDELTDLIEAAAVEPDDATRNSLYQQISTFLAENAWNVITHFADAIVAHDPAVEGWRFRYDGEGVPVYRDVRLGS